MIKKVDRSYFESMEMGDTLKAELDLMIILFNSELKGANKLC